MCQVFDPEVHPEVTESYVKPRSEFRDLKTLNAEWGIRPLSDATPAYFSSSTHRIYV
jgi:hypothetical protein